LAFFCDRLGRVAFSAHHARFGAGLLKLKLEAVKLGQPGCG